MAFKDLVPRLNKYLVNKGSDNFTFQGEKDKVKYDLILVFKETVMGYSYTEVDLETFTAKDVDQNFMATPDDMEKIALRFLNNVE